MSTSTKTTDRKNRNERTPQRVITGDQRSHGDKTAGQRYLGSFVLQLFCFVSIRSLVSNQHFCFGCLGSVPFILEPGFVLLLRVLRSVLVSHFNGRGLILMT